MDFCPIKHRTTWNAVLHGISAYMLGGASETALSASQGFRKDKPRIT